MPRLCFLIRGRRHGREPLNYLVRYMPAKQNSSPTSPRKDGEQCLAPSLDFLVSKSVPPTKTEESRKVMEGFSRASLRIKHCWHCPSTTLRVGLPGLRIGNFGITALHLMHPKSLRKEEIPHQTCPGREANSHRIACSRMGFHLQRKPVSGQTWKIHELRFSMSSESGRIYPETSIDSTCQPISVAFFQALGVLAAFKKWTW